MSEFVTNENNAARLLEWLDHGAPHTLFSLEFMGQSPDAVCHSDLPENVSEACGSVACIAGAASQMLDGTFGLYAPRGNDDFSWGVVQQQAIEFLGLVETDDQYATRHDFSFHDLFSPDLAREIIGDTATAAQAAQALRNTIQYGEPRWETV